MLSQTASACRPTSLAIFPHIMRTNISRLKHTFSSLAILLLTTSFFYAHAQTVAKEPTKGVLFEAKSGKNAVYLYGSIHLAKADFYPLPARVQAAYKQAKVLVVEVDSSDEKALSAAMPLMTYVAPDKLENHVTPATWKKLPTLTGETAERVQTLRPMTLCIGLVFEAFSHLGYDPQLGIDLHFIKRAKGDRKKIVELESLASQMELMNSISDEEGDELLSETLDALRSGTLTQETLKLFDAWRSGNAKAIEEAMRKIDEDAATKLFYKKLFDDRNVGMADKIAKMAQRGEKAFVVVGAGHLVGANSVVELLSQSGFKVKQVMY
jgi:uncharacterized protein